MEQLIWSVQLKDASEACKTKTKLFDWNIDFVNKYITAELWSITFHMNNNQSITKTTLRSILKMQM